MDEIAKLLSDDPGVMGEFFREDGTYVIVTYPGEVDIDQLESSLAVVGYPIDVREGCATRAEFERIEKSVNDVYSAASNEMSPMPGLASSINVKACRVDVVVSDQDLADKLSEVPGVNVTVDPGFRPSWDLGA